MCDFSLQHAKSRPASVADKLETRNFGRGTTGFIDPASQQGGNSDDWVAVCVLPGTEIAFDSNIMRRPVGFFYGESEPADLGHAVGIFRQINKDNPSAHHDALELPDGRHVLLTSLIEGQTATVLQLPAAPKNEAEAKEQERLEVVG